MSKKCKKIARTKLCRSAIVQCYKYNLQLIHEANNNNNNDRLTAFDPGQPG